MRVILPDIHVMGTIESMFFFQHAQPKKVQGSSRIGVLKTFLQTSYDN